MNEPTLIARNGGKKIEHAYAKQKGNNIVLLFVFLSRDT